MEPALYEGERIWVKKRAAIQTGDIAVFYVPEEENNYDNNLKSHYVFAKRCIGIPGDSVYAVKGVYYNSHYGCILAISADTRSHVYRRPLIDNDGDVSVGIFLNTPWTLYNFGPIQIPKKGNTFILNEITATIYKTLVEHETGRCPEVGETYTFTCNWYFFCGDNVINSYDSRFFGMIPEEYILGKVLFTER